MNNQNTAQLDETEIGGFLSQETVAGSRIRVFITDDHPLIRVGMAGLVREELDMEVCGEASTIEQTMEQIVKCQPDAVCVDISLAGEDGIELVKQIHSQNPAIGILVYTMHEDDVSTNRAMEAGAGACLGKKESPDQLVKMIRRLAKR